MVIVASCERALVTATPEVADAVTLASCALTPDADTFVLWTADIVPVDEGPPLTSVEETADPVTEPVDIFLPATMTEEAEAEETTSSLLDEPVAVVVLETDALIAVLPLLCAVVMVDDVFDAVIAPETALSPVADVADTCSTASAA